MSSQPMYHEDCHEQEVVWWRGGGEMVVMYNQHARFTAG